MRRERATLRPPHRYFSDREATATRFRKEIVMKKKRGKRPPWWFPLVVWGGIAGAAGVLAAAVGMASA
jgi:hypothetical protein